jgi:hypothetical protein
MNQNQTNSAKPQKQFVVIILYLVFICFLLIPNTRDCFGQSITWQRIYDGPFQWTDVGEDICDAGNGNFFIAGTTVRPNSYSSIFLLKINKFGDTLWTKYIDTAYGKAVTPSGDGGCVVTGLRGSAFTTKIDSNGNTVWFKKYTGNIVFIGYDIIKTSDNGYLICGTAYYDSAYVLKVDSIGDIKWQRFYSAGFRKSYRKITDGIDGGYIITGYINNSSTDTTRGLIVKIDSLGSVVNEKTFVLIGNTGVYDIDKINNQYLLCGDTYDGTNFRVFMKRIDSDFNDIYSKVFISDDNESTARIKGINKNRYVMSITRRTYTFPSRYYTKLIITDSIGTILNQKYYNAPGDLNIYSILPAANGDILFTGYAEYYNFPIKADVYTLRTDSLLVAPPPIGIENLNSKIPQGYYLYNFPNPFNPSTKIRYYVPKSSNIKIVIFDIQGKEIEILINENKNAGNHELDFDAGNLSSGVYFVKMVTDNGFQAARKIVLVK